MKQSTKKQIEKNIKNPFFSLAPSAKVKISVIQLAIRPIKLLFTNWQTLFLLGVPFAALLTLCSMLAGRSALCNADSGVILTSFYCSDSSTSYYLDVLIRFIIVSVFIIKWYKIALQKEPLTVRNILSFHKKEVKVLESDERIGAVCCELKRFGDKEQHIHRPKIWNLKNIVMDRKINGAGYAGGMMFRSSLLDKISINENYRMCEDFDFHLQILENMPIASIHEVLYFYRAHATNLCKSVKDVERINYIRTILKEHKEIYINKKSIQKSVKK